MANSAIAKRTQPTALSRELRPQSSRKIMVMKRLASTMLDRGEAMDEIRLESYSRALIEEFADDADTFTVLDRLSLTIRGAFDPIIPPKADLIRMVRGEDWARKRNAAEERRVREEREDAEQIAAEKAAGTWQTIDVDSAVRDVADKLAT
jgi:hypothetical protein